MYATLKPRNFDPQFFFTPNIFLDNSGKVISKLNPLDFLLKTILSSWCYFITSTSKMTIWLGKCPWIHIIIHSTRSLEITAALLQYFISFPFLRGAVLCLMTNLNLYQPSVTGGTRSPPETPNRPLNPKWPTRSGKRLNLRLFDPPINFR